MHASKAALYNMKTLRWFLQCLIFLASFDVFSQENCTNGKDDDHDGLVDLKDPDCQCHLTVTSNLLQNGSFEAFDHCPTYFYDQDFSIMDNWQFGTYTNGSEAIYYHNFVCKSDSSFVMQYIPPAVPLPDGKAFVSIQQSVYRKPNFKETDIAKTYISQCLSTPLTAGRSYTMSFSAGRFQSFDDPTFKYESEPFTVAVFGQSDCGAVPFGQSNVNSNGCPANYSGWTLLGKTTMRSKGKWVQGRVAFIAPKGVNAVAIGPDCSLLSPETELADSTTRSDYYSYYLDDIHLLETKDFPFSYIQTQNAYPCARASVLLAPAFPNSSYQWYKDSIAVAGATQQQYTVPQGETGNYNVRVTDSDTCIVSESYFVGPNALANLILPADTAFCKGETLVLAPAIDNVIYHWNGNAENSVNTRSPGQYEIEAIGTNGCTREFSVLVHEEDCSKGIYMPTAFTPNGDGLNDIFRIPKNSLIRLSEFSVYDRWGKKVFTTKNKNIGWRGMNDGENSPVATYVYLIKGTLGSKPIEAKGIVTLIR